VEFPRGSSATSSNNAKATSGAIAGTARESNTFDSRITFAAHADEALAEDSDFGRQRDVDVGNLRTEADDSRASDGRTPNRVKPGPRHPEIVVIDVARRFDNEDHISSEFLTTLDLGPDSRLVLCEIRSARFHVLAALC
jgi:hypothetical protein